MDRIDAVDREVGLREPGVKQLTQMHDGVDVCAVLGHRLDDLPVPQERR